MAQIPQIFYVLRIGFVSLRRLNYTFELVFGKVRNKFGVSHAFVISGVGQNAAGVDEERLHRENHCETASKYEIAHSKTHRPVVFGDVFGEDCCLQIFHRLGCDDAMQHGKYQRRFWTGLNQNYQTSSPAGLKSTIRSVTFFRRNKSDM